MANHRIPLLTFLAFALALSVTSCSPLSKIGNQGFNVDQLQPDSLQALNGTYSNIPDSIIREIIHGSNEISDFQQLTILEQFFWSIPETAGRDSTGEYVDPQTMHVTIKFQTPKRATVSLYHNERFIFSKNIRGKFKNGYFYIRPKILIVPLIPLVFGYHFERARIGKLNNKLVIDYTISRWAFALVAGSSDKGISSSIYKPLKTSGKHE